MNGEAVEPKDIVDFGTYDMDCYRDAEKYYSEHGDLLVPTNYLTEDGFRLGQWISTQRMIYTGKNGRPSIPEERVRRLEGIGMVWDIRTVFEQQWMETYRSVSVYFRQNGRLPLSPRSLTTENGIKMGPWIGQQRDLLSKRKISAEKRKLLSDIGIFPWGYTGGIDSRYSDDGILWDSDVQIS